MTRELASVRSGSGLPYSELSELGLVEDDSSESRYDGDREAAILDWMVAMFPGPERSERSEEQCVYSGGTQFLVA